MYYTKYRPQKFSEIMKPNAAAEALSNQIKTGKVSHAYLFVGPRGTGKTTTARILAKALNCKKTLKSGDPCDRCEACTAIKTASFLDLIEIDAASNRGIDDIRDLRDRIRLAPSSGEKKVYIIDEVHMLTTEAFNALLKTLEEPPSHAVFVLCTTEEHKVPDTIKSRCQVFKFKRATVDQIVQKLEDIAEKERVKTKVKRASLEKIARAAQGGFRDAETLLQQVVEGELDVDSFVNVGTLQNFVDFVDALQQRDSNSALRQVNKLHEDGVDLFIWVGEVLNYLRDLLFISADAHEGLLDVTENVFISMEEQAAKFDVQEIAYMIDVLIKAQNEIKSSDITQLPLEIAVIKLCEGEIEIVGNKTSKPSGKNPEEKKDFKPSEDGTVPLDTVVGAWDDVLKGVVEHNHGVQALLKASKPVSIEGNEVVLEVFYKFHKERLESGRNIKIVEKVLSDIFGVPLKLRCILGEGKPTIKIKNTTGELTDRNIKVPTKPESGDALADIFDGGLPL